MNKFLKADKNYLRKIIYLSGKAINQYKMVEHGDKILVAVSGGKDSLSLIDILVERRKFLPIDYELHAVHVITKDVPYAIDIDFLTGYCASHNVFLHFITTYAGLKEQSEKKPCFTCSWNRRKVLFDFARKNEFKKMALGHHLDDAIETLLMNMFAHGNISSIPASLSMFDSSIEVIRPLIYITNAEMIRYASIKQFVSLKKECPYEDLTLRLSTRKIINELEALHPKARINLFKSMKNIDMDYLVL